MTLFIVCVWGGGTFAMPFAFIRDSSAKHNTAFAHTLLWKPKVSIMLQMTTNAHLFRRQVINKSQSLKRDRTLSLNIPNLQTAPYNHVRSANLNE